MTETAEAPEQTPEVTFPDPLSKAAFQQIVDLTNSRNEKVGQINAVKGDPHSLLENLRETSDNKQAVTLRDKRNNLRDQLTEVEIELDKILKPEVDKMRANAEASVSEIEAAAKDLDGKIKAATNYFKKMYGDDLASHLPKLERAKTSLGGGSSSGSSRRIRGFEFTVTDPKSNDGKPTGYENVAQIAKAVNAETETLQEGFFKTANVQASKDAPNRVEWTVEVGEGDNRRTVTLVGTRKEQATNTEQAASTEQSGDTNAA